MRLSLHHIFSAVVVFLFCTSLFFTVRVVLFKNSLNSGAGAQSIKTGQTVIVTNIIDGDEVVIKTTEQQMTVRILGISAYDPTVNDPLVKPMAQQAYLFLERTLLNKQAQVVFDELKFDSRKRLLAYVHKDGVDVGQEMIVKGLALAYTKFTFTRMSPYLIAEEKARKEKAGLWEDSRLAKRSNQLKSLWDAERTRGD